MTHRPFPNGKFDKPSESLGFLLWQATNQWQRKIKVSLAPYGLTHVQFVLLAGLCWQEQDNGQDAITQKRLAEFCATDPMMTSQVLRTLEHAKLIERQAHPSDARARHLTLTDYGYKRLSEALASVEEADALHFSKIRSKQIEFGESLRQLLS